MTTVRPITLHGLCHVADSFCDGIEMDYSSNAGYIGVLRIMQKCTSQYIDYTATVRDAKLKISSVRGLHRDCQVETVAVRVQMVAISCYHVHRYWIIV